MVETKSYRFLKHKSLTYSIICLIELIAFLAVFIWQIKIQFADEQGKAFALWTNKHFFWTWIIAVGIIWLTILAGVIIGKIRTKFINYAPVAIIKGFTFVAMILLQLSALLISFDGDVRCALIVYVSIYFLYFASTAIGRRQEKIKHEIDNEVLIQLMKDHDDSKEKYQEMYDKLNNIVHVKTISTDTKVIVATKDPLETHVKPIDPNIKEAKDVKEEIKKMIETKKIKQ